MGEQVDARLENVEREALISVSRWFEPHSPFKRRGTVNIGTNHTGV